MILEAVRPCDNPSSTWLAARLPLHFIVIRLHCCLAASSRSCDGAWEATVARGEVTWPSSVGVRISDSRSGSCSSKSRFQWLDMLRIAPISWITRAIPAFKFRPLPLLAAPSSRLRKNSVGCLFLPQKDSGDLPFLDCWYEKGLWRK